VLKKAGIVVAAAAVGLLAVSPMAFAQETETETNGNMVNECTFEQTGATTDTDATNGSGLIDVLDVAANVVAPIDAQLNLLDCNNIGSTNVTDTDSHDDTKTVEKIKIKDSFNKD
jgi:hypothetical protein